MSVDRAMLSASRVDRVGYRVQPEDAGISNAKLDVMKKMIPVNRSQYEIALIRGRQSSDDPVNRGSR